MENLVAFLLGAFLGIAICAAIEGWEPRPKGNI
jgi:hypothetical protein